MDMCTSKQDQNEILQSDSRNDEFDCFNRRGLHLMHLNVWSLLPKVGDVRLLILNTRPMVLAVTETWQDGSIENKEVNLPSYNIIRRDRNRNGGGVCLYIRDDVHFNHRSELAREGQQVACVDLILPKTQPIIVGVCYRPPKQQNFYERFETLCSEINVANNECFFLGDFNTDVDISPRRSRLVDTLHKLTK